MMEQTFGVVIARWGILWLPLCCSLANGSTIIVLFQVSKLHNYIVYQGDKDGITTEVPSVPAVDPVLVHDVLHLDSETSRHVRQGPCELRDSIAN
jgi:hypothetical protein